MRSFVLRFKLAELLQLKQAALQDGDLVLKILQLRPKPGQSLLPVSRVRPKQVDDDRPVRRNDVCRGVLLCYWFATDVCRRHVGQARPVAAVRAASHAVSFGRMWSARSYAFWGQADSKSAALSPELRALWQFCYCPATNLANGT